MIITDLDGTLLTSQQKVSSTDYESLLRLERLGQIRVIATGRSPFSFSRVIPDNFPIDYLVFSSGAGIMDWRKKEIIQSFTLSDQTVYRIARLLIDEEVSFKILNPIPDNHLYAYHVNGELHPDFTRRMGLYSGYERILSVDEPNFGAASQFLIILPDDPLEYERLKSLCHGVKVVRATSPIDHESIWMEIFHPEVSKGNACRSLCDRLGEPYSKTFAIGNDYNDLDLLNFASQSYVVSNAPAELKEQYTIAPSHNDSGFTRALEEIGILTKSEA